MTTDSRNAAPDENDEIDLRQLLGTLVDHKWWVVGITGLFFAVAAAYALLSTPIYRADAIVQVEHVGGGSTTACDPAQQPL